MNERNPKPAYFDEYAIRYDEALQEALAATGENKIFYARGRISWMASRLKHRGHTTNSILDFGCGIGSAAPVLAGCFPGAGITGVDVSAASIEKARQQHPPPCRFLTLDQLEKEAQFDLAYCNGVFHHIAPAERLEVAKTVWKALKPGAYFAFFENNAWNPGTRYLMWRCSFDRDAVPLSIMEAGRLLKDSGFVFEAHAFLFLFPRVLSFLRWSETLLEVLPLGGQYVLLTRKPLK
ncbi:MAG: class I SAM-dependent methyltransferase [Methylacidiphilales bacterium]|nr:class I SAM-dependent methyltransferase [Candidatus Methylacidiphilales bacterium]